MECAHRFRCLLHDGSFELVELWFYYIISVCGTEMSWYLLVFSSSKVCVLSSRPISYQGFLSFIMLSSYIKLSSLFHFLPLSCLLPCRHVLYFNKYVILCRILENGTSSTAPLTRLFYILCNFV